MDLWVNVNGESDIQQPQAANHIPRCFNTTPLFPLYLNDNACERRLQKQIDELEEELRKE